MKNKNKIIVVAVILAVLGITWVWGGNYASDNGSNPPSSTGQADTSRKTAQTMATQPSESPQHLEQEAQKSALPEQSDEIQQSNEPQQANETKQLTAQPPTADQPTSLEQSPQQSTIASLPLTEATAQSQAAEAEKDEYFTDPVPSGKPLPAEPQDVTIENEASTCTLSVRCDTILANKKYLDKEKIELVPLDGVIFDTTEVTFYEGESVFNLLVREMKRAKIHMAFRNTPIYNSAYIEAINNLYEFDCGELSGWMYKVNGWFPNYGASRYKLKQGDVVEWVYTCNLGHDVGGGYAVGNSQ